MGGVGRGRADGRGWRLACACLLPGFGLLATPLALPAEEVYLQPAEFVESAFDGHPPSARNLWLRGELRDGIVSILGHPYAGLRVKYWQEGPRTVWILEEIGKYEPITTGVVVDGGRIAEIRILVYRESHGWEVRYPFFTDQFRGLELDRHMRLTGPIDGISGATLSVSSITRLAALALHLDAHVSAAADG